MITSNQNSLIKEIQLVQKKKKERIKQEVFIVEGLRAVEEIPKDWHVKKYVVAESFEAVANNIIKNSNAPVFYVIDEIFKNITDTKTPQGILAVVSFPKHSIEEVLSIDKGFFIIGDEIQDPGNLGTLIRTAHGAGADGVFLSEGCVDIYNPKTIRATMGSIFHIPTFTNIDIEWLVRELYRTNCNIYATALETNKTLYDYDYTQKTAIIIGNEANGIRQKTKDVVNDFIKIPMPGGSESLNASIAAGICMFEVVRQRTANGNLR